MTTVTIIIEQTELGLEVNRTTTKDNETYLEDWYTTKLLAALDDRDEKINQGRKPE